MKKTILIYGVVAGLISVSMFIGLMLLGKAGDIDHKNGAIYGYTLMIVGFAFIFVATRIIRDKYYGGTISFGKAFKTGLLITLVASSVYVIVWMIDYYLFIPDFMEKYTASILDSLKASGASQAEIAKQTEQMAMYTRMYKNPLFVALLTYAEILPVGLVVSLINAWVMSRKKKISVPVTS